MKFSEDFVWVSSMKNPLKALTKTERFLMISSGIVITAAYILSGAEGLLSWAVSIIGAISVIFVAKGYVFGQFLSIFFSFLYGVISLKYHYYGELLTYWCIMVIVSRNSAIQHYFDTKSMIWKQIFDENLTIPISMNIAHN